MYQLAGHRAFRAVNQRRKRQAMILGPSPVRDKYVGYYIGSENESDLEFFDCEEKNVWDEMTALLE